MTSQDIIKMINETLDAAASRQAEAAAKAAVNEETTLFLVEFYSMARMHEERREAK